MRPRIQRTITVLETRGVFGTCNCGGRVLYYSDSGVKCESCGKLYGVWSIRHKQAEKPGRPFDQGSEQDLWVPKGSALG
ncbi:MAG: hypothetical protein HYY67_07690 [Thaumarchaeota archaeon]|nr:hypothetical protein [Nitrososphaerota archaeon]